MSQNNVGQSINGKYINSYKLDLDTLLTESGVPHDLLQCNKISCKSEIHQKQIIALHNHIMQSCLVANNKNIPFDKTQKLTAKKKSISGWNKYIKEHRERAIFWHHLWKSAGSPQSCLVANNKNIPFDKTQKLTAKKKSISGWNKYIKEHRERAIFWHHLWKSAGSPQSGLVANIRRSTRAQYHCKVKHIKSQQESITMSSVAESIKTSNAKRACGKIKGVCSRKSTIPNCIDNVQGEANIAEMFRSKYDKLFSIASTSVSKLEQIRSRIDENIDSCCNHQKCYCDHDINVQDIKTVLRQLKYGVIDFIVTISYMDAIDSMLY